MLQDQKHRFGLDRRSVLNDPSLHGLPTIRPERLPEYHHARGGERYAPVGAEKRSGFSQAVLFDDEPRAASVAAMVPSGMEGRDRPTVMEALIGSIPVYAPSRKGLKLLRRITAVAGSVSMFTPLVMAGIDTVGKAVGLPPLIWIHDIAIAMEVSSMLTVAFIILLNTNPDYRRMCRLGLEHEGLNEDPGPQVAPLTQRPSAVTPIKMTGPPDKLR